MVITGPGLYDLPAKAYHADPAPVPSLSSSLAKILVSRTPAHARHAHPRLNPDWQESTPSADMLIGAAAHEMFLGKGHGIHILGAVNKDGDPVSDYKTKAAQEERDEALAGGKTPLLQHQADKAQDLADEVAEQLSWLDIAGSSEVAALWQRGPIWCRAMFDRLLDDQRTILDLKFTRTDGGPYGFPEQAARMGYDIQAAHYQRGLSEVTGTPAARLRFLFAVVEIGPPVLVCVHELPIELAIMGDRKLDYAYDLWARCMQTNTWPGYAPKIHVGDPPQWAIARWTERETVRELESA